MAVHKLNVKNVLSRVRQVFPNVPETYLINLVNDALVEIGVYSTKQIQAKMSTVADQMWYKLGDDAEDSSGNKLEANKVFRVDLMDSDGDYIQIPRLVDKNILLMDADSSESALTVPDSK
tara:strand:+ start:3395 stop:3754 length:360 start_codon:yes stop_codon:yes gene_type:complete